MLMSLSNLEQLVKREAFRDTNVKPAIRANDTTDVWRAARRDLSHQALAPVPHRLAQSARANSPTSGSIRSPSTTTSSATSRRSSAFADFRADAAAHGFSYFLEVFNPNASNLSDEDMPRFVNDAIVRTLAGLTEAERPRFLKIVYNGPARAR